MKEEILQIASDLREGHITSNEAKEQLLRLFGVNFSFGKRQSTQQQCSISSSCNYYDEHEQLLIEKVIEMLKTKPEYFSARWFTGKSLDKSVRSQNKEILIMIDSGQICHPVEPQMTKEQKELIKQLLEPIVKKDSDYLIELLVCNDAGL